MAEPGQHAALGLTGEPQLESRLPGIQAVLRLQVPGCSHAVVPCTRVLTLSSKLYAKNLLDD